MQFFRRIAEYTHFDVHKSQERILAQQKAVPFNEKLGRYRSNWLRHAVKMNNSRMAKIMLNCGL
jgi:hypothetical protein